MIEFVFKKVNNFKNNVSIIITTIICPAIQFYCIKKEKSH